MQDDVTLSRYMSGLTLEKWCEFIESRLESRGGLARVFDKLSPATHKELGSALKATSRYSTKALDEFCQAVAEVFGGPQIGLHLGAYSAEASFPVIENILASAAGDPIVLLRDKLQFLHNLYAVKGSVNFVPEGENGGMLVFVGYPHNEVSCYSNAGYVRKCLDLIGLEDASVGPVEHAKDILSACRIAVTWKVKASA